MHRETNPAILYFGTPVVLISTVNPDGSFNLAPMSSAWWLGWRCLLGLSTVSRTTQNLLRTGECVLNLPSADQVAAVNRIARTTGSDQVPEGKRVRGYRHLREKFATAGFTPEPSVTVQAPRALECPVQMEARLETTLPIAAGDPKWEGRSIALAVHIQKVHACESILLDGDPDRVDPDRWQPLIMSFQQYYGLRPGRLHDSELAKIPEAQYRP